MSAPALTFAAEIASRSEQSPLHVPSAVSAVLVTLNVAAPADPASTAVTSSAAATAMVVRIPMRSNRALLCAMPSGAGPRAFDSVQNGGHLRNDPSNRREVTRPAGRMETRGPGAPPLGCLPLRHVPQPTDSGDTGDTGTPTA